MPLSSHQPQLRNSGGGVFKDLSVTIAPFSLGVFIPLERHHVGAHDEIMSYAELLATKAAHLKPQKIDGLSLTTHLPVTGEIFFFPLFSFTKTSRRTVPGSESASVNPLLVACHAEIKFVSCL